MAIIFNGYDLSIGLVERQNLIQISEKYIYIFDNSFQILEFFLTCVSFNLLTIY